jgi:hypothetical protein
MTLFAAGRNRTGDDPFLRVARESGTAMKIADAAFFARHPALREAGYHPLAKLTPGLLEGMFEQGVATREKLAKWRNEYWELLRGAEISESPHATVMTVGDPVRKPMRVVQSCSFEWMKVSAANGDRHFALRLPLQRPEDRIGNPDQALAVLAGDSDSTEVAIAIRKRTGAGLCAAHRSAPLVVYDEDRGESILESKALAARTALTARHPRSCPEEWKRTFALWNLAPRRYRVEGVACDAPGQTARVLVYPDVSWDMDLRLPAGRAEGHATWTSGGEATDLLLDAPDDAAAAIADLDGIRWCHDAARQLSSLIRLDAPAERWRDTGFTAPVVSFVYRSAFRERADDWGVGVVGEFSLSFEPFFRADLDWDLTPMFCHLIRKQQEDWSYAFDRVIDRVTTDEGEWGSLRLRASGEIGGTLVARRRESPKEPFGYADGKDIEATIPRKLEFVPDDSRAGFFRIGFEGTGADEGLVRANLAVDWSGAMHGDDDFLDTVNVTWDLAASGMTLHVGEWVGVGSTWAPHGRAVEERHPEKIDTELLARPRHGAWLERAARRFRKDPPADRSFGSLKLSKPIASEGGANLLWVARAFVESLEGGER